MTGHIDTLLKEDESLRRIANEHSGKIALIIGSVFLAITVVGAYIATKAFAASQLTLARSALGTGVMEHKVNFIIERFATGAWTQFNFALTVFLLLSFVGAVTFATWAGVTADNPPQSFVLLTKRSEDHKIKAIGQRRRRLMSLIISVVASLTLGIAANIIFASFFS